MVAESRDSFISRAPIRRLMKGQGAQLVAEDAVTVLIDKLTETAREVTKQAMELVKADKRKRISPEDIKDAVKQI